MLAAASAQTVPWWGTGLFTISGAILGGAIAALVALSLDRRKAQRESKLADRERAHTAILAHLGEIDRLYNQFNSIFREEARLHLMYDSRLGPLLVNVKAVCSSGIVDLAERNESALTQIGKALDNDPVGDVIHSLLRRQFWDGVQKLLVVVRAEYGLEPLPPFKHAPFTEDEKRQMDEIRGKADGASPAEPGTPDRPAGRS